MKFLVDMPVSPQLATWLNEKGYNAVRYIKQKTSQFLKKQENKEE